MIFADALLDSETGDLPPHSPFASDPLILIAQRLDDRLRTPFGGYFLDENEGMPFEQWIQQSPPLVTEIGVFVEGRILSDPAIVRLVGYSADLVTIDGEPTVQIVAEEIVTDAGSLRLQFAPLGDQFGNLVPWIGFFDEA